MLPSIILAIAQLAIGWTFSGQVRSWVPQNIGALEIFLIAVAIAVLVWITGRLGALVHKDIPPPSAATLTACLVLALAGAALTLVPPVTQVVSSLPNGGVPLRAYPLIGAVIGYLVRI